MDIFVDNDVVIKLAEYDLLSSVVEIALEHGMDIFVLDSLPYVVGLAGGSKKKRIGDSAMAAVENLLQHTKFAAPKDISVFHKLDDMRYSSLDAGELALLVCAGERENSGFFTGDKRALKSLSRLIEQEQFTLSGCVVITLEKAVSILLKCRKGSEVARKIKARPEIDKALTLCFCSDSEESIWCGLSSYESEMARACQQLSFFQESC